MIPSVACIDEPATAERKRERPRETWRDTVAVSDSRARLVSG